MKSIKEINRLRAKVDELQKQIYHSPHFYQKWRAAKRALDKAIRANSGIQKSLSL
jgi:hypothetical protein